MKQPARTWRTMVHGAIAACTLLLASAAGAETVAVIGTGNVGMAIGTEFAGLGHTVIYGSRSPASLKTTDLVTRSGANASADPR